jgi:hypothetical protein
MNNQTKLLFIAASFATLSGCGGGGSASPTPAQAPALAPALAPIAAPDYVATDASCLAVMAAAGVTAAVGKVDDVAAYFGSFNVSLTSGGTTTFTLKHPGTATLKGVTLNIQSVCLADTNGVNWRRMSFANGYSFNLDVARTTGAIPGVNGDDFSVTTVPRGSFSGSKL